MKNQTNIIPPEETNKSPVTDSKEMEIYKWPDKKPKIIFKKLSTIQENTIKQMRKTIHEQNEKFNQKIFKTDHAEILELKNTPMELKNSIENSKSRLSHTVLHCLEHRVVLAPPYNT